MTVKRSVQIDAKRLMEDLNGNSRPHGLMLYLRETLGRNAVDQGFGSSMKPGFRKWSDDYVVQLRAYVDLWLQTGRRKGAETPAARRPTVEISHVVERVVTANRVLPAALKDGYAMAIVAVRQPLRQNYQSFAQAKPQSDLARERYASDDEYLRGLLQERYAGMLATPQAATPLAADVPMDDAIPTDAAERVFVEMVLSDWRLKIARCVNPACGTPYFRVKKWNHVYQRGTRCLACRDRQESGDKQRRVEDNRKEVSKKLWEFVAERFASGILRDANWYLDTSLKCDIAEAMNVYIDGDKLLKSIYPKAITAKWLSWAKNHEAITGLVRGRGEQKGRIAHGTRKAR